MLRLIASTLLVTSLFFLHNDRILAQTKEEATKDKSRNVEKANTVDEKKNDQSAKTAKEDKPVVYTTPEEVFEAGKKAVKEKKWKTFIGLFTEKSQNELLGSMVLVGTFAQMDGEDESKKEGIAAVKKVFNDHGLTEEKLNELQSDENATDEVDDSNLESPDYSKLVKDKLGFMDSMIKALEKLQGPDENPFNQFATFSMEDLKVDGDQATATLKISGFDDKVEFVKVDGSWKMQMPDPSGSSK